MTFLRNKKSRRYTDPFLATRVNTVNNTTHSEIHTIIEQ